MSFDVDGVLNDYPQGWINYVNDSLDSSFDDKSKMKRELASDLYNDLKDEYRRSDHKGNLPINSEIKDIIRSISNKRIKIFIVTSRPIDKIEKYPNLWSVTVDWLEKNDIYFDFFGKKERSLFRENHINYHVEDEIGDAIMIADMGIKTLLINNEDSVQHENIISVSDNSSISELVVNG